MAPVMRERPKCRFLAGKTAFFAVLSRKCLSMAEARKFAVTFYLQNGNGKIVSIGLAGDPIDYHLRRFSRLNRTADDGPGRPAASRPTLGIGCRTARHQTGSP